MMQPVERVITNPNGQVARRLIGKLIGDEMQAEMSIQLNRMERAARAMFNKLQAAEMRADRRLNVLMILGQKLDLGDIEFDDNGLPQIRTDLKKAKKADLQQELEGAWKHIEMLYAKLSEANQIIENEMLNAGSEP